MSITVEDRQFNVGDLAIYWQGISAKMFGEIVKINSVTVDVRDWTCMSGVNRIKIADFIRMNKRFDQERDTVRHYNPPYLITPEHVEEVIKAQQHIIDNPVRAMVNSESAFVRDILLKVDERLARDYWSWVCGACSKWTKLNFSDTRILTNQAKLKAVDDSVPPLPAWATYGT